MSFRDNLAEDIDKVFLNKDEFAEDIIYNHAEDDAKTIKAVFSEDLATIEYQETGQVYRREGTVFISTDPDDGIADPGYSDTVTINGEVWSVVSIAHKVGGMAEIVVVRLEAVEKGKKYIT